MYTVSSMLITFLSRFVVVVLLFFFVCFCFLLCSHVVCLFKVNCSTKLQDLPIDIVHRDVTVTAHRNTCTAAEFISILFFIFFCLLFCSVACQEWCVRCAFIKCATLYCRLAGQLIRRFFCIGTWKKINCTEQTKLYRHYDSCSCMTKNLNFHSFLCRPRFPELISFVQRVRATTHTTHTRIRHTRNTLDKKKNQYTKHQPSAAKKKKMI